MKTSPVYLSVYVYYKYLNRSYRKSMFFLKKHNFGAHKLGCQRRSFVATHLGRFSTEFRNVWTECSKDNTDQEAQKAFGEW